MQQSYQRPLVIQPRHKEFSNTDLPLQSEEQLESEEDRMKFQSGSKSPMDPSGVFGFEDYLVNTYEDQPRMVSQSSSANLPSAHYEMVDYRGRQSNRIILENPMEDDETNLLDETSRFVKNLNSGATWVDFGSNIALTTETAKPIGKGVNEHEHEQANSTNDSRQNLTVKKPHHSFVYSQCTSQKQGTADTRVAFQELTTNASRNPAYKAEAQLKYSELTGSGPSFQNDSSLFKSSGLPQQHQQQSHFITFKPASICGNDNALSSGGDSPVRNPFPTKFRSKSPLKENVGASKTQTVPRLQEMNFDDHIKKESECYKLPLSSGKREDTPQVLSQYSEKTSPATRQQRSDDLESVVGAQLTMSQLGTAQNAEKAQTSSKASSEHEIASNFGLGQLSQQKFVVSINAYPNLLSEMPSRIMEESQEFSLSLANLRENEVGIEKKGTLAISEQQLESESVNNIVDTQDSKFEILPEPVSVSELDQALSSERCQEVEAEQLKADMKVYISDGGCSSSGRPNAETNLHRQFREILSEKQDDYTGPNEPTVEQQSKQVRSQTGVNPYSMMEDPGPHSGDYMMLGLARALLKQLNSQRDHFSQETLVHVNSDSQIEAGDGQISLIEPDQATETVKEGSSCSELTARSSARQMHMGTTTIVNADESHYSNASSAKELYEMRMKGIRKKRESAKPKAKKQNSSHQQHQHQQHQHQHQSNKMPHYAQPVRQNFMQAKPEPAQKAVAAGPTVVDGTDLYRRNMQWKQQIENINAMKKQLQDHERVMEEVKECTFKPALVAKAQTQSHNLNSDFGNANSQEATKSYSGPAVEDRCLQWAAQSKKKKQNVVRLLDEYSECTFTPTLFSQEYKNRVCPSYDLKHKERVQTNALLTQEFNYFTLKNYLQMNDESVQDLERLCKLYSSSQAMSANKAGVAGEQLDADGDDNEITTAQLKKDKSRMIQIAEFVERSDAWIKQVQTKKEKVAQEVANKRDEENTFHPKVDPVSELLHARKLKKLGHSKPRAPSKNGRAQDMPLQVATGGLLENQKAENLYEYYMPKSRSKSRSKHLQQAKSSEGAFKGKSAAKVQDLPRQQQTRASQPHRPPSREKLKDIKKHEKRENKHPKEGEAPTIDFAAESRKFSKLIELLSHKLSEKPELYQGLLQAGKIPTNSEKMGGKGAVEAALSLCQKMLNNAPLIQTETDEHVSFANYQGSEQNEINGPNQPELVFSDQIIDTIQHQTSTSEETSRFQSIKTHSNRIKPLDLTRVVHQFAQGLLTPTLTDPNHFNGSDEQRQHRTQSIVDKQLNKLKSEVNQDTPSQESLFINQRPGCSTLLNSGPNTAQKAQMSDSLTQQNTKQGLKEHPNLQSHDHHRREQSQMSSSMRKYYDLIFKRQQLTSRQGDSEAFPKIDSFREAASLASRQKQEAEDLMSAATVRQAFQSSFDYGAFIEVSQFPHAQKSNSVLSESNATRRVTQSTCPPSRASNRIFRIQEPDPKTTKCYKIDKDVRSRSSSSNTDGLFRKRSKSRQSQTEQNSPPKDAAAAADAMSPAETPRTVATNIMTGDNIHNMILLEHIPPFLDEDTPTKNAKQSLISEATSHCSSLNKDPTICRLAQKLRGLKEKENSAAEQTTTEHD